MQVRDHQLTVDEPSQPAASDAGPDPQELLAASLASCTAITMEMYAARKGWDIGHVEVDVQYTPAERGCPTKFDLVLRLPEDLPEEQVERLRVIAAKCPCTAPSTARSCSRNASSACTWPPEAASHPDGLKLALADRGPPDQTRGGGARAAVPGAAGAEPTRSF